MMLRALIEGRRASGIRQVDLAERLDKPQSFVSKFETGERRLDLIEFLMIAQAIKLDVHALIDEISIALNPDTAA